MITSGGTHDVLTDQETLKGLLNRVRAVLFDFDGPLCDLFRGRSTASIADEVKVRARQEWNLLDAGAEACTDSHGMLRELAGMLDRYGQSALGGPPVWADTIVKKHEYAAVASAGAVDGVHILVDALHALGKRLLVVTNNAPGVVRAFLERTGLEPKFDGIYGRDPRDPRRMKPHPDPVLRALRRLSAVESDAVLLIGDQVTDFLAAREAGVLFLGYAQAESRARELDALRPEGVISSYAPLIGAAAELLREAATQSPGHPCASMAMRSQTESNQDCMRSTNAVP
ncbi:MULTISPECIES: HAD family hydrolase [unclassified Streptomyces]|uniref:HAD family hydrolase n=1 Tax=unclassified Streptomyces TaxID=2593676 RepID=UPI003D8C5381